MLCPKVNENRINTSCVQDQAENLPIARRLKDVGNQMK